MMVTSDDIIKITKSFGDLVGLNMTCPYTYGDSQGCVIGYVILIGGDRLFKLTCEPNFSHLDVIRGLGKVANQYVQEVSNAAENVKSPITPSDFTRMMRNLAERKDFTPEKRRDEMEKLLCTALVKFGYQEGVDIYMEAKEG